MSRRGNPPDIASSNASHPRRTHSRPRAAGGSGGGSNYVVKPTPVASASFTWERAGACQSVAGVKYALAEQCSERAHFTKYAAKAIIMAANLSAPAPVLPLLRAIAESLKSVDDDEEPDFESTLILRTIQYGQLETRRHPNISDRAPPANSPDYVPISEFEMYDVTEVIYERQQQKIVTKKFVQAPAAEGGHHYELKNVRAWPWSVRLTFDVQMAPEVGFAEDQDGETAAVSIDYAVELNLAYRGKAHQYHAPPQKDKDQCVAVAVGEINASTGNFVPWVTRPGGGSQFRQPELKAVYVQDQDLHEQLFYQTKWRLGEEEAVEPEIDGPDGGISGRYTFGGEDLCKTAYLTTLPGARESTWVELANFRIVKILNLYEFVDGSHAPYIKFLTRSQLDPEGTGTYYLEINDEVRGASTVGYKFLDCEGILQLEKLKTPADVSGLFHRMHSHLITSGLTPEMMRYLLIQHTLPSPTRVIVRFGRQPDGLYVSGNMAFKDGDMMSLEDAHVAVVPKFFEDQILPMPRTDYPKHVIIPFPHVRFVIGMNAWTNLMPQFFQNNLMPARAVFALSVMGLQASKIWGGETGFGHGCPFGWIFSTEPSTGKTEAALLAHSMLGYYHRAIWAGDATKPALFERFSQQADSTVIIDDVVINPNQPDSKVLAQLGRALFDRTSRAVTGKIRRPYSTALFTANTMVNEEDKAFQSRLICITFQALQEVQESDPNLYNQWLMIRELMSALTIDFESMLFNGKLDREAMQDCATYLQQAIGKKRDRNANMWGLLLYYMLNINFMFQCGAEDQAAVFEWMIKSVTKATYELNHHQSILDQFVLAVHKVKDVVASSPLGAQDRVIHWHNFRTTQKPQLAGAVSFYAVRLEMVCFVIKNVLGKTFRPAEIHSAITECGWASHGRAHFYDASTNSWPIQKSVLNEETNLMVNVPLTEAELLTSNTSQYRCIFFKKAKFDEITRDVERGSAVDIDYKNIIIASSNPDAGNYNLWACATGAAEEGEGWFGYRVQAQTTFSYFSGARNMLHVGSDTSELEILPIVERENRDAGFGSVERMFQPATLLEMFTYSACSLDAMAPAYKKIPFNSRDEADDELIPAPFFFGDASLPHSPEKPSHSSSPQHASPRVEHSFSPRSGHSGSPMGGAFSPPNTAGHCEEYEQSSVQRSPHPTGGTPGSNPLGDATLRASNTPGGDSQDSDEVRPIKRRRRTTPIAQFVDDEVGAGNEEEEENSDNSVNNFFNDEEESLESSLLRYVPGKCNNVIGEDENGDEIVCGDACNPAEQLCHYCRCGMHRMF